MIVHLQSTYTYNEYSDILNISYLYLCTVHGSETGRGLGPSGFVGGPVNLVLLAASVSDQQQPAPQSSSTPVSTNMCFDYMIITVTIKG